MDSCFLSLMLQLMMLVLGHTQLVCWLSLLPLGALCVGRLLRVILGGVGCLTLRCSFCMKDGLVRGLCLRKPLHGIVGPGTQFQCQLFLLV